MVERKFSTDEPPSAQEWDELSEPDKITVIRELCVEVLHKLQDMRKRRKENKEQLAVVGLVGATGSGKSSLIKALMKLPYDSPMIRVSSGAHTTRWPSLYYLEQDDSKLYFCDLPGLHGVEDSDRGITKESVDQVQEVVDSCIKYLDIILYCVYPMRIVEYMRRDVDKLRRTLGDDRVALVLTHSDAEFFDLNEHIQQLKLNEIKSQLKWPTANIFPTACKGYDPGSSTYGQPIVEGMDELRVFLVEAMSKAELLPRPFLETLLSNKAMLTASVVGVTAVVALSAWVAPAFVSMIISAAGFMASVLPRRF